MSGIAAAIAVGGIGSALIGANASKSAARTAADAAAANRPTPINVGQSMQDYINSISNVDLQNTIMGAEGQFRPGYMELNAADLQAGLIGTGGSRGALDFVSMSADRMAELNQRLATQNTEYVLDQLKSYGPEATAAYLAANPAFARSVAQMESLGGRQVSGYLNAMGDLAMQPGTGQTITAPAINAPANVSANQIGAPSSLTAQQISANQIGPTGTLTPQQVSAMMMGPMDAISPERVSANLLGSVGQLTPERVAAERVAAERIASERIAAGQVQAGEVGAGALGQSLYQQALRNQQLSPLSQALQAQGLGMAMTPGQITAEEARAATQGARERSASRGRLEDISAVTGEALARAGASRERQMQDIAAAQQINAQLLGAQQTGQSLATDVLRADIARQQANVATGLQAGTFNVDAALRAAQANQQTGLQASQANQDAMLRAALANQQTGLQAALANQQAGMEAGRFNIGNQMAIAQANMAAQNQFALANQQAGLSAAEINARNQLAVQQANQAAGNQFALANQAAGMQAGQFNISNATELARLNQAANLQAALANQQAGMQTGQFNVQAAQDAQRLNQAANLQAALANQQMGFNISQLGSQQNLQAQLANRQFGLDELTARFNRLNATTGMEQNMLNADRSYAERLAATLGNITPTAINLAGIGQNAAAIPLGFTGYGAGLDLSRDTGPRLFNPDTGVNIALGNQANQAGYGAAVAGGAASMAGARAGATASMAGSFAQSLPYLAGMMNFGGQTPTSTGTPPYLARGGTPYQAPGSGFRYGGPPG
jgi:hypothetical protein